MICQVMIWNHMHVCKTISEDDDWVLLGHEVIERAWQTSAQHHVSHIDIQYMISVNLLVCTTRSCSHILQGHDIVFKVTIHNMT